MVLDSIIVSKHIIEKDAVKLVINSSSILNMTTLMNKSYKELRSMSIKQVQWYGNETLVFTFNDGQ